MRCVAICSHPRQRSAGASCALGDMFNQAGVVPLATYSEQLSDLPLSADREARQESHSESAWAYEVFDELLHREGSTP